MQVPDIQQIPVAKQNTTKIPLRSSHVTTLDFGLFRPVFCMETIPGDSITLDHSQFVRALPMQSPTLGQCDLVTQTFHVPYRLAWPLYQPLMDGRKVVQLGLTTFQPNYNQPLITNSELVKLFAYPQSTFPLSETIQAGGDKEPASYDFSVYLSNEQEYIYITLTPRGRHVYSCLLSLGYSINWAFEDTTIMSALPLLAMFRAFYDHVANPLRVDLSQFERFMNPVYPMLTVQGAIIGQNVSAANIEPIFRLMMNVFFDDDYFTSAWTSVDGIDVNQNQGVSYDNGVTGGQVLSNVSESEVESLSLINSDINRNVIYASDIEFLDSVYKYVRRNNLVGTRSASQLLAQFGIRAEWLNALRSQRVGMSRTPIEISDVMATSTGASGSQSSVLGDYAGKALAFGGAKKMHFETKDYGLLITFATIMPRAMYYQGRKRHVFHIQREDFFRPDFDMLVGQPIRNDELFACAESYEEWIAGQGYGGNPDGVFGFCPRYTEYKVFGDYLTGDFRIPTLRTNMESLQMFREIAPPDAAHPLENNLNFAKLDFVDRRAYDRMFYVTNDSVDHFICSFYFTGSAVRPVASISDSQIPDSDNSRSVSMQVGSPKF